MRASFLLELAEPVTILEQGDSLELSELVLMIELSDSLLEICVSQSSIGAC
jgi:hypothetical protein